MAICFSALQQALGRTGSRHTPVVALSAYMVFSAAFALLVGLKYGPYGVYGFAGTVLGLGMEFIYIVISIGVIGFYRREHPAEFSPLRHGVLPILGALAFIPAFFAGAGIPAFSFISTLPRPLSYAGPATAIWMVIGIVYLVVLNVRAPQRIMETKRVFD